MLDSAYLGKNPQTAPETALSLSRVLDPNPHLFCHSSLESPWDTGLATHGLRFILLGSLEPTGNDPCHRRWLP